VLAAAASAIAGALALVVCVALAARARAWKGAAREAERRDWRRLEQLGARTLGASKLAAVAAAAADAATSAAAAEEEEAPKPNSPSASPSASPKRMHPASSSEIEAADDVDDDDDLEKGSGYERDDDSEAELEARSVEGFPCSVVAVDPDLDFGLDLDIDPSSELRLGRRLGSGSFGVVSECVFRGRACACKMLKPSIVQDLCEGLEEGDGDDESNRNLNNKLNLNLNGNNGSLAAARTFAREIQILASLPRHPHVVSLYAASLRPPTICLVEELVEGGSLADAIKAAAASSSSSSSPSSSSASSSSSSSPKSPNTTTAAAATSRLRAGGLEYSRVLRIGVDVAAALAHLHAHRVTHSDLKPANVLLNGSDRSRAKVCDFGVSRVIAGTIATCGNGNENNDTVAGVTAAYASPEQFESGPWSQSEFFFLSFISLARAREGKTFFKNQRRHSFTHPLTKTTTHRLARRHLGPGRRAQRDVVGREAAPGVLAAAAAHLPSGSAPPDPQDREVDACGLGGADPRVLGDRSGEEARGRGGATQAGGGAREGGGGGGEGRGGIEEKRRGSFDFFD